MRKVILLMLGLLLFSCQNKLNDKLKIAVIFPLTGNTGAAMSNNVKDALLMCVDSINGTGGVNNQQIDIQFYDCRNADPKEGVAIANRLISIDKPHIVISMISGVVLNTNPIFEQNKILNLAIASSANLFNTPKKYTLRTHISSNQTGQAIAKSIKGEFKKDKVKILYSNTEFGQASLKSFKVAADSLKIKYQCFPFEEKDLNYRNYILKAELANTDLLYTIGIQESLGRLIKQCKESGFQGVILGGPDINSFLATNNMGADKSNIFYTETGRGPLFQSFNANFFFKYNQPLDEISVLGCNGLLMVLACMEDGRTNNVDSLMSRINRFHYEGIMGPSSFYNNEMMFDFKVNKLKE